LANKSRNGKQFSWGRRPEPAIVDVVARIQGDLVMNAIPYFSGGGSVKYAKNTMWLVPPYRISFKWLSRTLSVFTN